MHGSKVPEWIIEAVQKCKSGDERSCKFVDRLIDMYFQARERAFSQTTVLLASSSVAAIVDLFAKFGIYVGLAAIAILIALAGWCWIRYMECSRVLESLCNTYLDPPMFVREARLFGIFILLYVIMLIILLILGYTIF